MKIVEIKDKNKYNNFIKQQKHSQFLQSWEWGKIQEKFGFSIYKVGVEKNNELIAVALLIKKKLFFNKYYFSCPYGPIYNNNEIFLELLNEIKKIAKKEKVIFLRAEPVDKIKNSIKTIDIQPKKTLVLNLTKPEDELLKKMKQKTRYNIKLAEKKGIKIVVETKNFSSKNLASQNPASKNPTSDFEKFWEIMQTTSKRNKFRLHPKNYYKQMLSAGGDEENNDLKIKLFLAKYNNKIIAVDIVCFFGNTATYLHGASLNEFRKVMAPNLLQWHVIKLAKAQGYKYYDFYGIDEQKWQGVTKFKKGFGGEEIVYPGTYDLVYNKFLYNIYTLLRKIKRFF